MASELTERQQAIKHIKDRKGFLAHLMAYAIVNVALLALWAMSGRGYYWPMWTAFGWGIGVAFHGFAVLFGESEPDEAAVDREMNRMHGHTAGPSPSL